jgi:hypothetical protein
MSAVFVKDTGTMTKSLDQIQSFYAASATTCRFRSRQNRSRLRAGDIFA